MFLQFKKFRNTYYIPLQIIKYKEIILFDYLLEVLL